MKLTYIIAAAAALLVILIVRSRSVIASPPDGSLNSPATEGDIERLVHAGRKIDAIKAYRRLHQVDLKTAKDAIDRLATRA